MCSHPGFLFRSFGAVWVLRLSAALMATVASSHYFSPQMRSCSRISGLCWLWTSSSSSIGSLPSSQVREDSLSVLSSIHPSVAAFLLSSCDHLLICFSAIIPKCGGGGGGVVVAAAACKVCSFLRFPSPPPNPPLTPPLTPPLPF